MRPRSVPFLLLSGLFLPLAGAAQTPQTAPQTQAPYTLHIPVDEISLTFHASDPNGTPLTHLTIHDLALTDNGKAQNHLVLLQSFEDLPIRAGFLFDISNSMLGEVEFNRSIIRTYASRLLRKGYDRAFVELFDTEPLITQAWTDDDTFIAIGAAKVQGREDHLPATAIFDTLYATCRDQWKPNADTATGNFILIFTDGMDDASHAYLREAVDMCQRTRTAIYAIVNHRKLRFSQGQPTLEALVEQTGGRLFFNPQGHEILEDLAIMEAEQRNQYRLVYKPSKFKADSSFHRIKLQCSIPGARIAIRSGYYAFARP
jgi:VWFA-related protein